MTSVYLILLIVSFLICFSLFFYLIRLKSEKQICKPFICISLIQVIHCLSLILQILNPQINPILFENFAYISVFLPVAILFAGIIYAKTEIKFRKSYLLLFVVPCLSLVLLWTNSSHHLFYEQYSTEMNETIPGPYFVVHSIYSYCLLFIGLLYLLRYSIKNSGFFSKQSIFIVLGTLIPVTLNILGTFSIIPMAVYVTPISFSFAILFYAIAIFKFQFLKVSPIALQKIVDSMSDAYIVINKEYQIIDFNKPLQNTSIFKDSNLRNKNILDIIKANPSFKIDMDKFKETLEKTKVSAKTYVFEKHFASIHKYFNVEISGIFSKTTFIGDLILFKDITQHMEDLQTIENNQDMLIEKERLASLGQMIGRYST